jgi:hypothetical protein
MKKNTLWIIIGLLLFSFYFFPKIMLFVFGVVTALTLSVVVFLVSAPFVADKLITTPKNPKHIWGLPLFATVENGRAKAIVDAGGNVRRYIMNKNGTGLRGEVLGDDQDTKWDVVDSNSFSNSRNSWEKWIEDTTGLIFVGVYPWRKVYHYEIHLTKVLTKGGVRELVRKDPEISDHVRVREFSWGAQVEVVLKGFFRITILFSFRLQCTNPHKMLFGVDQWDESFADAVTSRAIELIQSMKPEDLMNASDADKKYITNAITDINSGVPPRIEENWGLKIIQTQISKFGFESLSDEEKKSLTIKEVTGRRMEARELEYTTEASGQEEVLEKRASVIKNFGESGLAASRDEMLENVAKEGNQTIVTGLGGGKQSASDEKLERLLKAFLARQDKK